jgi:NDP-sugar pyrophosphorylase family protein
MTLPVAILAGGLATRLQPVTDRIPKSLVEVAGEPFVLRQLRYLASQGVREVVLCVGHLGEQVQAVVGDGQALGLSVRYSWDGAVALGTGGALRQALPLIGRAFFVFYGDSYLPIDFGQVERAFHGCGKSALMTVLRNSDRWDRSNVEVDSGHIVEYNKRSPRSSMRHIDYGLAILEADEVRGFPQASPFDLSELFHQLSLSDGLACHEVHTRFYEIGSHRGLSETIEYFISKGDL